VLSPADIAEEASEYHPLLSLAVISQPGLARGQTYYPLISFQISKTLQVCEQWICTAQLLFAHQVHAAGASCTQQQALT